MTTSLNGAAAPARLGDPTTGPSRRSCAATRLASADGQSSGQSLRAGTQRDHSAQPAGWRPARRHDRHRAGV